MSIRGSELVQTANRQISGLIDLLTQAGEAALLLPCPGRENMADGTVAAVAVHTADRYQQIADFLHAASSGSQHGPRHDRHHRRHGRHARAEHAGGAHPDSEPGTARTAQTVDLSALLVRLSAARDALGRLVLLTDDQLNAVPPADSFRFCDGQRNLAQVMASLLKHQGHQIDALVAAITNDHSSRSVAPDR
jgi:hypothetical protein